MKLKKILYDSYASVVPIILFVLGIFGCGALYSLFFIEFALPELSGFIPDSDYKTYILMIIYAIPLLVFFVAFFSVLKSGVKQYGGV